MIRRTFQVSTSSVFCALLFWGASAQAAQAPGDVAKGKEVFEQCSVCHNVDTEEKKMGPSLKGLFKKAKLQNGKKISDESVMEQINNGGNGMPAYGDMLSKDDRDNLLAYLKTL